VLRVVDRVFPFGQLRHSGLNALGLVNRALFTDGQMHRQVQKRVRVTRLDGVSLFQGPGGVGQDVVKFRVFVDPLGGQGLQSVHGFALSRMEKDFAKKATNIIL
jgi:hypothetical protein